jgi:hypothetical protein
MRGYQVGGSPPGSPRGSPRGSMSAGSQRNLPTTSSGSGVRSPATPGSGIRAGAAMGLQI